MWLKTNIFRILKNISQKIFHSFIGSIKIFYLNVTSVSCGESLLPLLRENADVHQVSEVFVKVESVANQQLVWHLEANVVR